MADDVIPAEIREFIDAYIDSVAQLEALLLLRRERETTWDASSTASRLYIPPEEADEILKKLADDGFLVSNAGRFQFGCRTPEAQMLVDRLAHLYARQLIPVTRLIHSKPDRIRQFADAFKLRRES